MLIHHMLFKNYHAYLKVYMVYPQAFRGYFLDRLRSPLNRSQKWSLLRIGLWNLRDKQLRTAGFVVDGHSCYRSCRNSCMKFPARLLTGEELLRYWPQIDQATKFPTATAALERIGTHGYSVLLCRLFGASGKEGGIIVNLSFQQTLEICQGRNYSNVLALLAQGCACKSKCAVITNTVLRTLALRTLENTQYGAHSIVSNTPALGLVLFSRKYLAGDGKWQNFVEPEELSSSHARSFGKFTDRLRLFSRPQVSIQARCVAFNTFIQSVMLYAISYFGITSKDLNFLRQAAVRLVLKRHWLEAEIMPYVLRYVGVATVTDPALAVSCYDLHPWVVSSARRWPYGTLVGRQTRAANGCYPHSLGYVARVCTLGTIAGGHLQRQRRPTSYSVSSQKRDMPKYAIGGSHCPA